MLKNLNPIGPGILISLLTTGVLLHASNSVHRAKLSILPTYTLSIITLYVGGGVNKFLDSAHFAPVQE